MAETELRFKPDVNAMCAHVEELLVLRADYAVQQVEAFEAETGHCLPALVRIQGCNRKIWLHRLVSFTGRRFMRTLIEPTGKRSRESDQLASNGLLSFDVGEADAAWQAIDIMNGKPPHLLSVQQALALVHISGMLMADDLLAGMGAYLAPMIGELKGEQVTLMLQAALLHSMGDTIAPLSSFLPTLEENLGTQASTHSAAFCAAVDSLLQFASSCSSPAQGRTPAAVFLEHAQQTKSAVAMALYVLMAVKVCAGTCAQQPIHGEQISLAVREANMAEGSLQHVLHAVASICAADKQCSCQTSVLTALLRVRVQAPCASHVDEPAALGPGGSFRAFDGIEGYDVFVALCTSNDLKQPKELQSTGCHICIKLVRIVRSSDAQAAGTPLSKKKEKNTNDLNEDAYELQVRVQQTERAQGCAQLHYEVFKHHNAWQGRARLWTSAVSEGRGGARRRGALNVASPADDSLACGSLVPGPLSVLRHKVPHCELASGGLGSIFVVLVMLQKEEGQ